MLHEIVRRLASRPGVSAALLVGRDGLVIDRAGTAALDVEGLAALAVTLQRTAGELAATAGAGTASSLVVETASGAAVLSPAGPEAVLLVLAAAESDLGEILWMLRQERAVLVPQL